MTYKTKRPRRGWPALFSLWKIGDSMLVCGSMRHVRRCIIAMNNELSEFRLQFFSRSLTRVTRIA